MSKRIIVLSLVLILLMLAATVHFTHLGSYMNFEDFKNNSALFRDYVKSNYFLAVLYYIGLYFVVAAFSIPGAFVLSIAGGFLFGAAAATIYVLAGATSGAILAFIASKYLLGDYLQKRYKKELLYFNKEMSENEKYYILMLRFISVLPFFLLNILAGLTKLDLKTFIWTTAIGILPSTLIYTYAGHNLSGIEEPTDLLSVKILTGFVLLGLFSILPVILNKFKK
ncbi:MAG: TVP38/TMEM64 family protein [Candidatus Firestonebacteria bacterium]|nr:TVP38/TMEM64 family protein [Candidatus Firestonebacteria bacterium]